MDFSRVGLAYPVNFMDKLLHQFAKHPLAQAWVSRILGELSELNELVDLLSPVDHDAPEVQASLEGVQVF